MEFAHYFSFGDSMSIDAYAGPGLGAASLLYSNRNDFWPEFAGQDLKSLNPDLLFHGLAADGSTLIDAWHQLEICPKVEGRVLVSLTLGGNDVLAGLGQGDNAYRYRDRQAKYIEGQGPVSMSEWLDSYHRWLDTIELKYPDCVIVLGNIYDPTEGTGRLAGGGDISKLMPHLLNLNEELARVAAQRHLLFADIWRHFRGHVAEWIYREIEPTQMGSSEIRRLFWNCLKDCATDPDVEAN